MYRAVVALAEGLGCKVASFARDGVAKVLGVTAQAGQALKTSLRYQSSCFFSDSSLLRGKRCGHQNGSNSVSFIYWDQ